jgi:hypothetical protein
MSISSGGAMLDILKGKKIEEVLASILFVSGDGVEIKDIQEKLDLKDKEMEKLIDTCYDVMFQRQAEMEELGLLNYGDSSYYIQNPDEYEKDRKICELEDEVERLEHQLANCIEPKFKVGQELYWVYTSNQRFPFKVKVLGFVIKDLGGIRQNFYEIEENEIDMGCYNEKQFFATEEEAKAKVREIQDGNQKV